MTKYHSNSFNLIALLIYKYMVILLHLKKNKFWFLLPLPGSSVKRPPTRLVYFINIFKEDKSREENDTTIEC